MLRYMEIGASCQIRLAHCGSRSCGVSSLSLQTPASPLVNRRMLKPHRQRDHRNIKFLIALILAATAYSVWFQQGHALTGNFTLDGSITVLLGLYICARPAGNAIDLFFFERNWSRQITARWSSLSWLALNILTLLMGWVVLYLGTMRLTSRGG